MNYYVIIFVLLLVPTCTTNHKMADNQKSSGHFRLYSYPDALKLSTWDKSRYKKIVIVSSNDFQGEIYPKITPIPNKFNETRRLKTGGIAGMRAYLDIFQRQFSQNMLYIDAGSFLAQSKNHLQTVFLYKYLGVDVASIGLNELLIDPPPNMTSRSYLNQLTQSAKFDLVNSNLFDLAEAEQMIFTGSQDTIIKEVNGLKVGFVSILTTKNSEKIPDSKINGIYIQNPTKNVLAKATSMRRKGAHIIVLMANEGIDCTSQLAHAKNIAATKVNFNPLESTHCDSYKNEFYQILQKLPKGTIDLALTSGAESKVVNFIHGIPVVQNPGKGQYLSWVELFFDTKHNILVSNMTRLHQPVMLCHQFFEQNQDCYPEGNLSNLELIPAKFLGQKVEIKSIPATYR